ncbi:c-type cytochrome [Caulobacter segnis]
MTFAYRLAALALAVGVAASAIALADGKSLFNDNCSACHQITGKGVKGAFPALAGSTLGPGRSATADHHGVERPRRHAGLRGRSQ